MPPQSRPFAVRARATLLLIVASYALAPVADAAAVRCTVSASGVAFGIYDPSSASPTLSSGSVTTTCTLVGGGSAFLPVTSSFSTGSSGSYANRTLRAGADSLLYNLYLDAAHTQVAGDGTGGSGTGNTSMLLFRSQPIQSWSEPIYGQLPAGQDVAPGTYLDSIVVTINY